jgi:catechol 2,3-dioxygenase-like lactoylglutathione lyase family enzyme
VPPLAHVALAVSDPDRSLRFYRETLGLEGDIVPKEYGFVIRTTTGIQFTLFGGEVPPKMGEFHIGLSLPTPEAVRDLRAKAASEGLTEHEWWDEPGYVSLKVLDPDGYIVELSCEDEDHADLSCEGHDDADLTTPAT